MAAECMVAVVRAAGEGAARAAAAEEEVVVMEAAAMAVEEATVAVRGAETALAPRGSSRRSCNQRWPPIDRN